MGEERGPSQPEHLFMAPPARCWRMCAKIPLLIITNILSPLSFSLFFRGERETLFWPDIVVAALKASAVCVSGRGCSSSRSRRLDEGFQALSSLYGWPLSPLCRRARLGAWKLGLGPPLSAVPKGQFACQAYDIRREECMNSSIRVCQAAGRELQTKEEGGRRNLPKEVFFQIFLLTKR